MKKKGFTLIELLAVIVILAVLMVIAVPKILDVIENSKKSAAKSSAELYVDAINKYVAINEVNNKGINIPSDNDLTMGNADDDVELSKIKIKGDTPDYVTISFENGKVKEAGFCINDQNVEYKKGNVTISETDYCKFATVESLSVDNPISSMIIGEEYQLTVSIEPADVVPIYTSSNANIAEVSSTGLITAKASGNTNIIVKAGQKSVVFILQVIKDPNAGLLGHVAKTNFTDDSVSQATIEDVTYSLHTYVFNGNQTWDSDRSFGSDDDVATADVDAKNMVVVKVNGDLVINEGVTVTTHASADGYGGPKGFLLYVTGNIINKGTISMTARGARAVGENVYLWQNDDGTYEYIPAVGANGGVGVSMGTSIPGENGTLRATGGGGAGGSWGTDALKGGNGGAGTSYSGGAGGGGTYHIAAVGKYAGSDGSSTGGAGGAGAVRGTSNTNGYASGGSGNPSGLGAYASKLTDKRGTHTTYAKNGTGGLLVIYTSSLINNGTISSNGSNVEGIRHASTNRYAGGGASGGGSINIFYTAFTNNGSITATGGTNTVDTTGIATSVLGGVGGDGTITTCSIASGNCIID